MSASVVLLHLPINYLSFRKTIGVVLVVVLLINMKVNVTPRRTHTHRDLGRIKIIHRPII